MEADNLSPKRVTTNGRRGATRQMPDIALYPIWSSPLPPFGARHSPIWGDAWNLILMFLLLCII
jgi:hypothetical protein